MDEKTFQEIQGELLRKYRRQKMWTIEQVAEKTQMDEKHLSKIENGKYNPTSNTLFKLIVALDIPNAFFGTLKNKMNDHLNKEQ